MAGEQRTRFVNRSSTPARTPRNDELAVDEHAVDDPHEEQATIRRRDDLDEQATVRRPSVLDLPPDPPLTLDEDVDDEMPTTTKRR